MNHRVFIPAAVLLTVFLTAGSASAAMVYGDLLGVFAGNDSEAAVFSDTGFEVIELAKVDAPATSHDGLSYVGTSFNDDNEPNGGTWSYTNWGLVDILVVKAGNNYAAYRYTDANTSNMRNLGLWKTDDLPTNGKEPKGLSHLTAYQLVPEPGTAALATLGLACLLPRRRRN